MPSRTGEEETRRRYWRSGAGSSSGSPFGSVEPAPRSPVAACRRPSAVVCIVWRLRRPAPGGLGRTHCRRHADRGGPRLQCATTRPSCRASSASIIVRKFQHSPSFIPPSAPFVAGSRHVQAQNWQRCRDLPPSASDDGDAGAAVRTWSNNRCPSASIGVPRRPWSVRRGSTPGRGIMRAFAVSRHLRGAGAKQSGVKAKGRRLAQCFARGGGSVFDEGRHQAQGGGRGTARNSRATNHFAPDAGITWAVRRMKKETFRTDR